VSLQALWELRKQRAAKSFNVSAAEKQIIEHHDRRQKALTELRKLEDLTRLELRSMGYGEDEAQLYKADELTDAYIEGLTAMKLGVIP
jgi:hypothetical protein